MLLVASKENCTTSIPRRHLKHLNFYCLEFLIFRKALYSGVSEHLFRQSSVVCVKLFKFQSEIKQISDDDNYTLTGTAIICLFSGQKTLFTALKN